MTPALAGWIVLGMCCAAALAVMLVGVFYVVRSLRVLKSKLGRLEEKQRRAFDPERLSAAMARISRDGEAAKDLIERARLAIATIGIAARYAAVAVRVVRLLT